MRPTPYQFFEGILEVIHYDGDRTEMSQKFFEACKVKAIQSMMDADPGADHEKIKADIDAHPDAFYETLEKATGEFFKTYLDAVIPHLTDDEKKDLADYLQKNLPPDAGSEQN